MIGVWVVLMRDGRRGGYGGDVESGFDVGMISEGSDGFGIF